MFCVTINASHRNIYIQKCYILAFPLLLVHKWLTTPFLVPDSSLCSCYCRTCESSSTIHYSIKISYPSPILQHGGHLIIQGIQSQHIYLADTKNSMIVELIGHTSTNELPIQWTVGVLLSSVKRQECQVDHLPPPSTAVNNAWCYTFTPSYIFTA